MATWTAREGGESDRCYDLQETVSQGHGASAVCGVGVQSSEMQSRAVNGSSGETQRNRERLEEFYHAEVGCA